MGNQAVARVLAQRRTIARSCDETDEAAQVALHNAYFDQCVDEGLNMIGMAMSQRRPAAAQPQPQPAASAPPPQVLPRGSTVLAARALSRPWPTTKGVYESDEDERDGAPGDDDRPADPRRRRREHGGADRRAAAGRLSLGAHLRLPLYQQPADERQDEGMDEDDGGHLGRKLARNYSSNAPRPNKTKLTRVPKFTGLAPHGDNLGVLAAGVASTAKVKRRGLGDGDGHGSEHGPAGLVELHPADRHGPEGDRPHPVHHGLPAQQGLRRAGGI